MNTPCCVVAIFDSDYDTKYKLRKICLYAQHISTSQQHWVWECGNYTRSKKVVLLKTNCNLPCKLRTLKSLEYVLQRSLTSKLRDQPSSIPEEDESESDDEDDDKEDDEKEDDDESDEEKRCV